MKNILFLNRNWELSASRFVLLFSVFNTFLFNISLYYYLNTNLEVFSKSGFLIIASITTLIFILNVITLSLLVLITPSLSKGFLIITAVINSAALYFMNTYSVVLDLTMIGNVFNTRVSEASQLLTSSTLYLYILILGVLPCYIIFKTRIANLNRIKVIINLSVVLIVGLTFILTNTSSWLWISKHRAMVRGKVLPWSYVINTARYTSGKLKGKGQLILLPDGKFADNKKVVVVLVIGESARAFNFSLFGYKRDTNPYLETDGVLAFNKTHSCATYTTASVACILAPNKNMVGDYENLPSYLTRTGADVIWRTNNWGEHDVHVDDYKTIGQLEKNCKPEICPLDENLLIGLKQRIESSDKQKVFVVLHTDGSHGPSYYTRYSPGFEKFNPVCKHEDLSKCTHQEFINAYDNSIVYTDYFLHKTIAMLKELSNTPTMLVYISDHGESLGEKGLYLHGMPYAFAPEYQKVVPFIIWRSKKFIEYQGVATRDINQSGHFSQADVFHTIIGGFDLKTDVYNKSLDVLRPGQRAISSYASDKN